MGVPTMGRLHHISGDEHLNNAFRNRWIGQNVHVTWSGHSPDSTSIFSEKIFKTVGVP